LAGATASIAKNTQTDVALRIEDLRGGPVGREIIKGVTLEVPAGEVHAIMGPNGSGKTTLAHLLMGKPGYRITGGRVYVAGVDITDLPTYRKARQGLFVGFQYPVALPGIRLERVVRAAMAELGATGSTAYRGESGPPDTLEKDLKRLAAELRLDPDLLERGLNTDYSGGEKKRAEILQMILLEPKAAVLDEIDSGLDIDALRTVAREIDEAAERGVGVLLITHYKRILEHVEPAGVHVLVDGRIVRSGGPELAEELEQTGYKIATAN
jgi:Fe-S cluster assembly ATP-binding protein